MAGVFGGDDDLDEAAAAVLEGALDLEERGGLPWPRIFKESGKAVLLQVAAPLSTLVQTAVLGSADYHALSIYTLVSSATSLASVVFNFLTDGVAAKVSKSVGREDWALTRLHVFLSYAFAAALGLACTGLLLAVFKPIFLAAAMPKDTQALAFKFYLVKAFTVPVQQIFMATAGILSGYERLGLAAGLNLARAAMDIAGTFVSLVAMRGGLVQLGLASLVSYGTCALAGLYAVLTSRPKRAPETFRLFRTPPPGRADPGMAASGVSEETHLQSPLIQPAAEDESGRGGEGEASVQSQRPHRRDFWDFVYDSSNMLVRSMALQGSFFIAAVLASRLPDRIEALAAHGIVVQLWMLTSYITDGFANVGTIFGGRYYGRWRPLDKVLFRRMTERLVFCGLTVGLLFSVALLVARGPITRVFTLKNSGSKPLVLLYLGKVWPVLALMQPINSLVFVYDGLIYAVQRFRYSPKRKEN